MSFISSFGLTSDTYPISLVKTPSNENPGKTEDPTYRRLPCIPIEGTISYSEGVNIPGIDNRDIFYYEICDKNEILLMSFANERDFIDFLFSVNVNDNVTYMVRFITNEYSYTGFITIQ